MKKQTLTERFKEIEAKIETIEKEKICNKLPKPLILNLEGERITLTTIEETAEFLQRVILA